uniref:Plectin/eS10 N-terminal domain-containing protein n=1 Tax=Timspurckia oligopyrenoides TaxID=708627 RepID=A0A7S1ERY2_9RHOD|mmetsp:Transcript_3311/g.5805  ORF Transcript_3311/g.5805 Transcript_3311/m.5805 type:complete len:134 (+) Transcript_3311:63-464(+)|eukprot:CAMPEP_0182441180 /NCGR_PEP_ID=MMETSP1172-20130603/131_1 /TAXON_ID=708627 /ORGANISM="Timspurckia oligopyrenoides, Strain CCMP3278" /LENGTH=133 /DNA_ID=CAMNT_0024635345 /DNA_START=63 /DNA_END=464 /DNA_ORIENTATION=-
MMIPKKDRVTVYSQLFKDGVMVVEKDMFAEKHMELDVPNLFVMKLCQSLQTREFVKGRFNWNHYYYFLTDAGVQFLRGYLNIPSNAMPNTLVKPRPTAPVGARGDMGEKRPGPGGDFRPDFRRDNEYRSAPKQ